MQMVNTGGLKTGVKMTFVWSEIGSGFGEPGGTPPPRILRIPPPVPVSYEQSNQQRATSGDPFTRARANILPEGGFNIPKCARSVCRIDQSFRKARVHF